MNTRVSIYTGLFSVFFALFFTSSFSHPLDISHTTLTPGPDGLYGETYIHPYELSLLAMKNRMNLHQSNFHQLSQIVIPYFIKHFKVFAGSQLLKLQNVKADSTDYAEILNDGLYLTFTIPKLSGQPIYHFEITLFITFFSTQTNKLLLLDENGQAKDTYREVYFTRKRTKWTLDLLNPDFSADIDDNRDTDMDGFTDHLEGLYGTNPESKDTDGDGFTDFEEFYMGWDPLNYRASKGQTWKALTQIAKIGNPFSSGRDLAQDSKKATRHGQDVDIMHEVGSPDTATLLSTREEDVDSTKAARPRSTNGNGDLAAALQKIEVRLHGSWTLGGLLTVLGIVFMLGFTHALSAGHGKGILISYMLDVNHQFGHALRFTFIFTITHLIDVILLGIGGMKISRAIDPNTLTPILQPVGGIGLLIIAMFQIFAGFRKLRPQNADEDDSQSLAARFICFIKEFGLFSTRSRKSTRADRANSNPSSNKRSAWLMGFLTGLVPCPFGWALVMMLLNVEKAAFAFLATPIFGLGILISLLLCAMLVLILRHGALHLFKGAEKYSILVSGIMLIIFSIYYMLPGYTF